MFKFIKILLVFCLVASNAMALDNVNIFAYSRKAPDEKIYDDYGKAYKLSDFSGDFLIVLFWSKKCIPCLRELDDLQEFVNKTQGNGVKLIMVSPQKDWAVEGEQQAFLSKFEADKVPHFVDRNGKLATAFGIFATPHAVLVDAKSMEIGRIRGSLDWEDDDVIEEIYKIKAGNRPQ